MNPSEIKKIMAEIGGSANKRLGQHFLIDRAALDAIVEAADIKAGDRVLEVGPGLGVLTRALIKKGAGVTAIEQDRRFVEYFSRSVVPAQAGTQSEGMDSSLRWNDNVKVIHGDAARLDWMELVGDRPWKFVSNLPYSITSLALRKALWSPKPPEMVTVLVQREVAERAIAKDGKSSLLSLMVALASSSAKIVKRVPAGAFFPAPKVESAILQIIPMSLAERKAKWGIDPEKIMEFAKRGFAHPRKFLVSNLGLDAEQKKRLVEAGIAEKARAEDLPPEIWARLAAVFSRMEDV